LPGEESACRSRDEIADEKDCRNGRADLDDKITGFFIKLRRVELNKRVLDGTAQNLRIEKRTRVTEFLGKQIGGRGITRCRRPEPAAGE